MTPRRSFLSSSVGSKYLIAITGLCLVGFLILHLIGNLLIYVSPDTFNGYGQKLIDNPLVIPAELGLVALFLVHVVKTVALWMSGNEARPVGYEAKKWARHTSRKSWASTTMILSGTFLFVFVLLHLATFKYGAHYESLTHPGTRDLYRLTVEIFSSPVQVAFYVIGMVIVGFHLWHGVASAFQSLGAGEPTWAARIRAGGWVLAAIIAGGFITIPLWVYFGVR